MTIVVNCVIKHGINMTNPQTTFEITSKVSKVDNSLGLVFGYAMVCKINGEDHYDLQGDHIPEDTMLKVSKEFSERGAVAKEMHQGDKVGTFTFLFPMTTEIAKSLNIQVEQTGLLVAMCPDNPETLAKFASGEFTGFSIGGLFPSYEDVE